MFTVLYTLYTLLLSENDPHQCTMFSSCTCFTCIIPRFLYILSLQILFSSPLISSLFMPFFIPSCQSWVCGYFPPEGEVPVPYFPVYVLLLETCLLEKLYCLRDIFFMFNCPSHLTLSVDSRCSWATCCSSWARRRRPKPSTTPSWRPSPRISAWWLWPVTTLSPSTGRCSAPFTSFLI